MTPLNKNKNKNDKSNKKRFEKGTVRRVLRMLRPELPFLLLSLLFAAISSILLLIIPLLTGNAIDLMIGKSNVDWNGVVQISIQIGVCVALTALSQWLMNVLNNRMAYGLVYRLRKEAFEKLQKLPLSYLDSHSVGEIVSRMMTDAEQFTEGLLLGLNQFFTGMITIFGTIGIMLAIKPSVAVVVIFITPLSLFVASFIASRTYQFFQKQSKVRAEETAMIDEYIGNHKVVAAFGQEENAQKQFDEINGRLQKCSLKALFISSTTNPSTRFVNNLVYAGVALVGAMLCLPLGAAAFTVGRLTAFLSYATQYTKPFNEISGVVAEIQNSLACAARLFELLDEEPILPDAPNAVVPDSVTGSVTLTDVAFSYTPERELIRGLNLQVAPGQRVAIVGPTGCGKTTIINLLMRFYDVDAGCISIDGNDIRDLKRASLRASWGMVLQETWLRAATVRENIAMGKPEATMEEVVAAARAVHADSFIRRLPQGYDTVLGENGGSLSQGQKQLLCIARVMLAPPPMLILDEATSSIDTRMELKIQNAFAELMRGRTSFIVAHRLSTIQEADVILVMRDGKIIEQGSHETLLQKDGFYAHLYNSQFES
ncbi:MAG: ABC transporter ATP-binding protein [Ruminococcaceae bacterium]|nr:ABC transporter ATP-binding protein [Oscillospiraceae bacterium]